ncbi:MAG: ABC transporter permease [Bacteroidetes bacterium]|nr:MAG: ABC transporter permease [Bacteroidota bacterium]
MKRFAGFVWKEFLHIFRDPRTLAILFGLPVVMIVLFGYVVTSDIRDVRIGIWDRSGDGVTREAISRLLSSGYFIDAGRVEREEEIGAMFRSGRARVVVIFEPGFERTLVRENRAAIRLVADASDANTAQLAQSYLHGVLLGYFRDLGGEAGLPWQIDVKPRMFYNESMKGVYMFVPGLMALILMLISALMTSVTITREKEFGTMELLLASPLKPREIILGKVTPYILLSFINAMTIVLLGFLVFGVPVAGSLWLLMIESLLYITVALSLGVLISTVARTQQMAMVFSMLGLMLPTILLSGFIFPIDNMPAILQWLSTIMPARWFIVIIKNIMLKGTGFMFVWKETVILARMTAVFILAAVRRFRIRLE